MPASSSPHASLCEGPRVDGPIADPAMTISPVGIEAGQASQETKRLRAPRQAKRPCDVSDTKAVRADDDFEGTSENRAFSAAAFPGACKRDHDALLIPSVPHA